MRISVFRDRYLEQMRLLLRLIPYIAKEADFALKGGTAINVFFRDLPRLSVDIDLVYLPIADRESSLLAITDALARVGRQLEATQSDIRARLAAGGGNQATRLLVSSPSATVKVEVSPVLRGTLFPPVRMSVSKQVEEHFGFAEMQVVAFAELFAGKIVAALDRSHPRDLFDIQYLLAEGDFSDELFRAVLVYLVCSNRPVHELLAPREVGLDELFSGEFEGMVSMSVALGELLETRRQLVATLRDRTRGSAADFLVGIHDGRPDFGLLNLTQAAELPAVRWKLQNLERLKARDPVKHARQLEDLKQILEIS